MAFPYLYLIQFHRPFDKEPSKNRFRFSQIDISMNSIEKESSFVALMLAPKPVGWLVGWMTW